MRRHSNRFHKNVNEQYYFASCGDEFFRDKGKLYEFVTGKIPRNVYPNKKEEEYYQLIEIIDYQDNLAEILGSEITDDENVTCVFFYVCRLNSIPFFHTEIFYEEVFSTNSDFHSMLYNEQINLQNYHHVWIVFNWFKIKQTDQNK